MQDEKKSSSLTPENPAAAFKGTKSGLGRLFNALRYSLDGIKAAIEEAGFRELLMLHSVLLVVLIFLPLPLTQKMLLVFASGASLVTELLNTALEAAVDHTSTAIHPLAKRAKDAGSAAQYTCLAFVFTLWAMALYGTFLS
mgnify:FL=1